MANHNKGELESKLPKECPFSGKVCMTDRCQLYIEIMQGRKVLGNVQMIKTSVCVFEALAMILSNKPAQQLTSPVFRGG